MSTHAPKYHVTQKTPNGPTYRVEILEDGFGGSSTEKDALGEIFTLEAESLDPKTVYSNTAQKSSLSLYLAIEDATDLAILTGMLGADEDQYRLRLKIDGTTYWEGAVLGDLIEYSEGDYPFPGKIVAKDLSRLKGQTYTLTTGRDTIITVIADILSGLDLGIGIKTVTSWTEKNITDSDDFLNEISLDKSRIRQFAQTEEETDQPYDKFTVLDMLCKNFGLILRQQDGYWWIVQITALANDPATVYEYNSSGVLQSSSSVDLDAPVNKVDRWLMPQGQNRSFAGLKKVEVDFTHNTKEQVLTLPERIVLTDSNKVIDPIDFLSDGSQTIRLSCMVEADESSGAAEVSAFIEYRVGSSGNYYYLDNSGDSLEWSTSQTDYEIELDDFSVDPEGPGVADENTIDSSGRWIKRFGVDIESPEIPADADGTIRITFKPAQDQTPAIVDETRYFNIEHEIVNPTIQENNRSIHYELEQTGNYSESFSFGDTWFGDGPAAYSKSALTWFDGVVNVATVSEWRRDGGSAELALQVLLLRELLDIQRNHIQGKRAALLGDYKTQQIVTTDSGNDRYFFLLGQLSGKRSEWDGFLFKIDINTAGDDTIGEFFDEDEGGGNSSGGGGGGGESPDAVGEITSALSGMYSSDPDHIPVEVYSGKAIQSGKDYYIYNLRKKRPISFTALEDLEVGKYNLDIQEQRIVAPSGSKIYKEEGQKETERLIQVEQQTATESARASLSLSVKNERQGTSLGVTSNQVSGTVTSIDLESIPFEVKVEDGDRLTILSTDDSDEGNNEEIVVNGDQTLSAGTATLQINSIALSNTYPAGSAVFEPAVGLTSRITLVSEVTTSNSSSIASLETDVSALESTLVLKAEVTSGEITKLAFIQLDASIAGGSAITLAADQIKISGDTTFVSGYDPSDTRATIKQATAPTARPSGDPLQVGDIWLDTDDGNKPYSWNGSSFDPDYTNIDGGNITTGTIAAARITIGAGSTFNQGYDPSDGRVVIRQNAEPSARPSGDPLKSGDVWIDTNDGDKPYTYNGSSFIAAYTVIDGGNITTGTVTAAQIDVDDLFAEDITIGTNGVIHANFDGTISSGAITADGTTGWAVDYTGYAVFNDITIREGDFVNPNFSGNAVGLINIVSTFANLPASGEKDGDTYYVEDEPGGLYVWRSADSEWKDTRNGQFILADSISASKIQVATLSAITADIGAANISDTLAMGASGEITNSGGDYTIDADGISFEIGTGSAQSIEWYDGATRNAFVNTTAAGMLQLAGWDGSQVNVGIEVDDSVSTLLETHLATDSGEIRLGSSSNEIPEFPWGSSISVDSRRIYKSGNYLRIGNVDFKPFPIPIFTDATRPSASSYRGGLIYNSDARSGNGGLQFADETGTWIGS